MKKELLMASALVTTLGATSVAQAVTATMAGSMKVGVEFESPGGSAIDTNNVKDQSNFRASSRHIDSNCRTRPFSIQE